MIFVHLSTESMHTLQTPINQSINNDLRKITLTCPGRGVGTLVAFVQIDVELARVLKGPLNTLSISDSLNAHIAEAGMPVLKICQ
jgi:hypothetical protein